MKGALRDVVEAAVVAADADLDAALGCTPPLSNAVLLRWTESAVRRLNEDLFKEAAMGFDPSVDRPRRGPLAANDPLKVSVIQQVRDLLRGNSHRWWTALDVENALRASSAGRRMRDIMEADRLSVAEFPEAERAARREYEEREVANVIRRGDHKEFRWKGRQEPRPPTLF